MIRLRPLQQLQWRFALRYTPITSAVLLIEIVTNAQLQVLQTIRPVGQTRVPLAASAPPDPLGMLAERALQGERDPARLHHYQQGHFSLVVPVEGRRRHKPPA